MKNSWIDNFSKNLEKYFVKPWSKDNVFDYENDEYYHIITQDLVNKLDELTDPKGFNHTELLKDIDKNVYISVYGDPIKLEELMALDWNKGKAHQEKVEGLSYYSEKIIVQTIQQELKSGVFDNYIPVHFFDDLLMLSLLQERNSNV